MLREQVQSALKVAQFDKNDKKVATLRLVLAAIKDRDIATRGDGERTVISDEEILQILQTMIKQRNESIKLYEQGGRLELVAQENEEINIIKEFLPKQLSESEIESIVDELIKELGAQGLKAMGQMMAALKERYPGSMDFAKASQIVKRKLS